MPEAWVQIPPVSWFLAFFFVYCCCTLLYYEYSSYCTGTLCFVLFFGLESSCSSSCCFARAAVICSSSARIILRMLFLQPFRFCWITFFRIPVGFCCLFSSDFSYFSGLACFVVFSYQVRYSISLALPWIIAVVLFFLCLSLWPHNLYLSGMKNQHRHGVYWCRWVERTVSWEDITHISWLGGLLVGGWYMLLLYCCCAYRGFVGWCTPHIYRDWVGYWWVDGICCCCTAVVPMVGSWVGVWVFLLYHIRASF